MRKVILAVAAALLMSAQLAPTARAEGTTIIRKDAPDHTTIIKKHDEDRAIVREPSEKRVIIHKDQDRDQD